MSEGVRTCAGNFRGEKEISSGRDESLTDQIRLSSRCVSRHRILPEKCREVGATLGTLINAATSFILKSSDPVV